MARPQTDIEAGRLQLLEAVDSVVRARGSADISMNEVAAAAGMSPSNLYRFFETKEALFEAVAETWFADKIRIMEEVCASDMSPRDKMVAFFARRFRVMVEQHDADPALFRSYMEIGTQHIETIRGYVDLGDHFLSVLVADAMEEGYFAGFSLDEAVSLINQMMHVYINPDQLINIGTGKLKEHKLEQIVDTIFAGLTKSAENMDPQITIVS
jgi:TetR/AcrR family transcriptional regulator, repressor of the ameABC operon